MNHRIFGRKLSRTHNERRRLLQGLSRDMLQHGSIRTTLAKAKAVQPLIEKLITKGKRGAASDMLQIRKILADRVSVDSLLEQAKTRFGGRSSGYTRIDKLGPRGSDGAQLAHLSFVDEAVAAEVVKPAGTVPAPGAKPAKKGKTPEAKKRGRTAKAAT